MSVSLVSDLHLSLIVTWAIDNGCLPPSTTPLKVFHSFHRENVKSLRSQDPNYIDRVISEWKYTPLFDEIKHPIIEKQIAIAIIKLIDYYEDHSTEHNPDMDDKVWIIAEEFRTHAFKIAEHTKPYTIHNHPIYKLAPCEYTPQAWHDFIAQL